jgi:hypothetical protein
VSRVERQLEVKECAIVAFFDIEGASDSTSIDTIKQAMIRRDVPVALVDWTESMLAGRRIMVYHGEECFKIHQIEAVHREGFYTHQCVPFSKRPFRGFTKRRLSRP